MNIRHRILCVEDDADSSEVMQFSLERQGFEVVSCPTSKEGLEHAKAGGFLAIVLDHRLANISGFEMCREIRKYDQKTVIIFYTASAYKMDIKEGLESGANYYFVKPLDFNRVAETITELTLEKSLDITSGWNPAQNLDYENCNVICSFYN